MRKLVLMLGMAVMVFSLVVVSGPAFADLNTTTTSTVDSDFFGFDPSAFLTTFTMLSSGGSATNYIPNGLIPGSLTQRPDRVVNAGGLTDFGCGPLAAGTLCVQAVLNLADRVNTDGQNTAPTGGGAGANGVDNLASVLTGDLTSVVSLSAIDDGMPSGSITFTRSTALLSGFNQTVQSQIGGGTFQDFTEHDYTLSPFTSTTARTYNVSGTPLTTAIRTVLSVTQASMGGDAPGVDAIGYTLDWNHLSGHPGNGNYFTPGLGNANWLGNTPTVDTDGFCVC